MILEKYRPRTLDEYIGNTDALHSLASFARGNIKDAEAILLFGQPGSGKTTLALAFCRTNGFIPIEVNASDTRRKKDAQSLSRAAVGSTLTRSGPPKKRVLIIDECEGATAFLNNIMNDQHMKILICNEVMKIPYHIRERLHIVEVKRPKIGDYTKLFKRLDIEPETYKDVIKKFRSWRDCLNWIEGGDPYGPIILSDTQQAQMIFTGRKVNPGQKLSIDLRKLLNYFLFNGGDPDVAAKVDLLLHSGGRSRRLAQDILFSARLHKKIRRPPYIVASSSSSPRKSEGGITISLKLLGFEDE